MSESTTVIMVVPSGDVFDLETFTHFTKERWRSVPVRCSRKSYDVQEDAYNRAKQIAEDTHKLTGSPVEVWIANVVHRISD